MAFLAVQTIATALVVTIVLYIVNDARAVTAKYRHLPWVGCDSPSWLALIRCRVKNLTNLQAEYPNLTERVCWVM